MPSQSDFPESNIERLQTQQQTQLSESRSSMNSPSVPSMQRAHPSLTAQSVQTDGNRTTLMAPAVPPSPESPPLTPSFPVLEKIQKARAVISGNGKTKASKTKMTDVEEEIMLKEIQAARAHVAPHGKTLELFDHAAENINSNPLFKGTVNGRCLNDRFKRRMNSFLASDRKNAAASGLGGGVTEVENLLYNMHNAMYSMKELDKAKRNELNEAEKAKIDAGKSLLEMATGEEQGSDGEEGKSDEEKDQRSCRLAGPKRRRVQPGRQAAVVSGSGLESIGDSMREIELAEIKFKERQLEFEAQKHADLIEERNKERLCEKEKEEARGKLELEKFKLMMEMSGQAMLNGMKALLENKDK